MMQKKGKDKKQGGHKGEQQQAAADEGKEKHQGKKLGEQQEEQQNPAEDATLLTEELESTREEIQSLKTQLQEANDKFLRLFSEFDNHRKRVAKERQELYKTAAEGVISALLPVLDDLERASEVARAKADGNAEEEGVVLIYNKFKAILKQKGVEEIPAEGEAFNTDYHDAVTHLPAENKEEKGKVKEVLQKGYLLNGKVIRHARVVVAN